MEDPPILVLGNKRDIDTDIQVTQQEISEFQEQNKGTIIFYEVSARSGHHVYEAFVQLCVKMMDVKNKVIEILFCL